MVVHKKREYLLAAILSRVNLNSPLSERVLLPLGDIVLSHTHETMYAIIRLSKFINDKYVKDTANTLKTNPRNLNKTDKITIDEIIDKPHEWVIYEGKEMPLLFQNVTIDNSLFGNSQFLKGTSGFSSLSIYVQGPIILPLHVNSLEEYNFARF